MKRSLAVLAALALAPFSHAEARDTVVYIGTQGDNVLAAHFDTKTGRLGPAEPAAHVNRPTWITIDPKDRLLFAVSEIGNYDGQHGAVSSFRINARTATLTRLSTVDSGGGGPTQLTFERRNRTLFVADFGSGHVAAVPVEADGRLLPPTSIQRETGNGPHPKQKSAHPHAAMLDPSGQWLVVPDMGADRVFIYRFGKGHTLSPAALPSVFTGPGTGPRHLAFSRNGRFAYLITEHSAEVRVFRWHAMRGELEQIQAVALDPADVTNHSAAEIVVSPDGRFLYTSNRGRDRLQAFAIDRRKGSIEPIQDISSGGDRPRSFVITPDGRWLIAGNQDSLTVAVFSVDRRTGQLTQVGDPIGVPEKPVSFAVFALGQMGRHGD